MVDEVETLRTSWRSPAWRRPHLPTILSPDIGGSRRDPDGHLLNIYSDHTQGRAV
jgi:hypothetical protein